MKLGMTADVHLTTCARHPERYNALESILVCLDELDITDLIIAGDLFDHNVQNLGEFEALCVRHKRVTLHVIPGNHDPDLDATHIVAPNVRVYSEPTLVDLGQPILFVPYRSSTTMGEAVVPFQDQLAAQAWVLVGHGDYYGGSGQVNPYEPGTYMPLSRSDVERLRPRTVLLGHIHVPVDEAPIYYPGSPCGLDVTESGRRRFLVYDTSTSIVTAQPLVTDVLYFQESFMVLPREDEVQRLRREVQQRIVDWGVDDSEMSRIQVRVAAHGFCLDRKAITQILEDEFSGITSYKDAGPDVSKLFVSTNGEMEWLASQVEQLINQQDWTGALDSDAPDRDQILEQALRVIYGQGTAS